jgi:hypothetical protein
MAARALQAGKNRLLELANNHPAMKFPNCISVCHVSKGGGPC